MPLLAHAHAYCQTRKIKPVPIYSAQRFVAIVGDIEPIDITQAHVEQYAAAAHGSLSTIRGHIKDVITLCRAAGNASLRQIVRKPQPTPDPTPIASIDAVWPHLAAWSRNLVALGYWTALRLDDLISLQIQGVDASSEAIRWQASKTGKNHVWPMPSWSSSWLSSVELPYSKSNDHAQVIVRGELERVADIADVPRIFPQQLRQRAVVEWTRANATAGAIVHGMGLGVMTHYLDPLAVLEGAAPRVRVPACFGASKTHDTESSLLSHFRRLDPSAQSLITGTAERLAAG
jgi:integrase